jgi:hypothetical protein
MIHDEFYDPLMTNLTMERTRTVACDLGAARRALAGNFCDTYVAIRSSLTQSHQDLDRRYCQRDRGRYWSDEEWNRHYCFASRVPSQGLRNSGSEGSGRKRCSRRPSGTTSLSGTRAGHSRSPQLEQWSMDGHGRVKTGANTGWSVRSWSDVKLVTCIDWQSRGKMYALHLLEYIQF